MTALPLFIGDDAAPLPTTLRRYEPSGVPGGRRRRTPGSGREQQIQGVRWSDQLGQRFALLRLGVASATDHYRHRDRSGGVRRTNHGS